MLLSAKGQATACPDRAHVLPTCPASTHTCIIRTLQEGTLTTCSPQGPRALARPPLDGRDYWGKSRGGKKRLCLVCPKPSKGCPIFSNSNLPGSPDSCRDS